jgi:hypothetical protein
MLRNLGGVALTGGALVLAGCGGGGSPAAANTTEARFVALANTICRDSKAHPRARSRPGRPAVAREEPSASKLRALLASDAKLPGVGILRADFLARRRARIAVLHSVSPTTEGIVANTVELFEQLYRTNARLWADEKALGLNSCAGSPPRKPIGG